MDKPQMHPLPIDEIMNNPKVLVDLFVQLRPDKFILVAKAGTNTATTQLMKFKEKGVGYLFVRANDFHALTQQSITVAEMAVGENAISNLSKLTVVAEALNSVHREIEKIGINEQVLMHAKLVANAALVLVAGNPGLCEVVERFKGLPDEAVKHSMMVSLVSVLLGQGLEWVKPATLEKLALGGLLHDVGKVKLPAEVVHKNVTRMSHDEMVIYKSHPELGRQMLSGIKGLPDDVLLVIYEHHELSDGSGFPRGMKDFMISPLARVVSLANGYADLLMANNGPLNAPAAKKAVDLIEIQRATLYNKDAIRALRRLVDNESAKKQAV